jgi:hypothetical protein
MAVLKRSPFLCLSPEHLIIPIGVEWRIDVDKVYAAIGQRLQSVKAIATVDNPRVKKSGGPHIFRIGRFAGPD